MKCADEHEAVETNDERYADRRIVSPRGNRKSAGGVASMALLAASVPGRVVSVGDHWPTSGQIVKMTPCASTGHRVYVEVIGMSTSSKFDLPQGTLDLLILRVVALGPIHGYAIAQRIQMISKEVLQIQQGSLYPTALHRLGKQEFSGSRMGTDRNGPRGEILSADSEGSHSTQDRNRELGAPD